MSFENKRRGVAGRSPAEGAALPITYVMGRPALAGLKRGGGFPRFPSKPRFSLHFDWDAFLWKLGGEAGCARVTETEF